MQCRIMTTISGKNHSQFQHLQRYTVSQSPYVTNIIKPTKLSPKGLRATIQSTNIKEKSLENSKVMLDSSKSSEGIQPIRKMPLSKSLPPKNWMFGKRSMHTSSTRQSFDHFDSTFRSGSSIQGTPAPNARNKAFLQRNQIKAAKRMVIKLGSAVITREDGNGLALGRLASIVEQVSELQNAGHECVMITSGAVAFGRQKLSQELMMSMSMRDTMSAGGNTKEDVKEHMRSGVLKMPNAAVGQSGMQALYETMFRNYGILVGQVLVTQPDFANMETKRQLFQTIQELLHLNIIPIINTNDAVSPPPQSIVDYGDNIGIKDNDSLAAKVAVEIGADLAILMSDVDGIYNKPPNEDGARIMHTFLPSDLNNIKFGAASSVGTGGMESKVKSALWALERGTSVVICNGMEYNTIRKIYNGSRTGSFFTNAEDEGIPVEVMAQNARSGSRKLQSLSPSERANVITNIADALVERKDEILTANRKDLEEARIAGVSGPLFDRLAFTEGKIKSLANGLHQIADNSFENVGKVLRRTKVSNTLDLVQKTVPIGVLMVIFESRPDALPQVASLAVASANGLLLKGGKEAKHSNEMLMSIVKDALGNYGVADAISMVSTREATTDLLKMDQYIDLVIPRGSGELVKEIKEKSKLIPVLGHAEGVCHVYIDRMANIDTAIKIVLDSKTDYPAACNALETLLIHEDLLSNGMFEAICAKLKANGVTIYSGPNLDSKLTFGPPPATKLRHEYGDLACTIEVVRSMYDAIDHIHKYGSSHTDAIVSEDREAVESFLNGVDSACVFANCSTRMSDGYRLGLGAEVGISTGRIHARGPVGVEGLLTTKWMLDGDGDTASDYATGQRVFEHEQLPTSAAFSAEIK